MDALRLAAMLERFMSNDVGRQKATRMERASRMKKNIASTGVDSKMPRSISHALMMDAMIPIAASAANEMMPILVIGFSNFVNCFILSEY